MEACRWDGGDGLLRLGSRLKAAKMMPSRKKKLTEHAAHVLDQFIGLRGKFAVLEPMLFDWTVAARWGSGTRSQAFRTLGNTMLNACILDIVNIALDNDKRTPSITKLMGALDDERLVAELREDFAIWGLRPAGESDPNILRILEAADRHEEEMRRQKFDLLLEDAGTRWQEIVESPVLSGFRSMRDKLIAHNELWHDGSGYRPLDVSTLGLRYGDVKAVIEQIQPLVDCLTLLYRNASYDFPMLIQQLTRARDEFWSGERRA